MQTEINQEMQLLKEDGTLTKEGFARKPFWKYDKSKIKAHRFRNKEWDYYYIINHDFGLTLTIADLGYASFAAFAWLDFKNKDVIQFDSLKLLSKLDFPPDSSEGEIHYKDSKLDIKFNYEKGKRVLSVNCPEYQLFGEIILEDKEEDSICIATSWKENRKRFYYNQKINCLEASGKVQFKGKEYDFSDSLAGLDWGRGSWTYKNRWYWASASDYLDGKRIGWNLGYGFTDRTPASEDMLFYDGRAIKLDRISWELNPNNYMENWKFSSKEGDFELNFKPIVDRASKTNLLIIKSIQHQVFGIYSGFVTIDGKKMEFDNIIGFAEDVLNYW